MWPDRQEINRLLHGAQRMNAGSATLSEHVVAKHSIDILQIRKSFSPRVNRTSGADEINRRCIKVTGDVMSTASVI